MSPNDDAGNSVLNSLEQIQFKPGDILLREGERSYYFYIIQEGEIEVYRTSPDGTKYVLNRVEAVQPLGEFALITQSPRSASAVALTSGSAVKVNEENYKRLIETLPEWAFAVIQSLIQRLKFVNDSVRRGDSVDIEKTVIEKTVVDWD